MTKATRPPRQNTFRHIVLQALIDLKRASVSELADYTGLTKPQVQRAMTDLRPNDGPVSQRQAYVASWRLGPNGWVMLFAPGAHYDAKKPAKLSRTEVNRRYFEKRRRKILGASIFNFGLSECAMGVHGPAKRMRSLKRAESRLAANDSQKAAA